MEYLVKFLLLFIFVYILFYFMMVFKNKKKSPLNAPSEIAYLIKRYSLNLSDAMYKKLLKGTALINALSFSLAISLTENIDNYILRISMSALILIPLILVAYHFWGTYFKKKGMKQDV